MRKPRRSWTKSYLESLTVGQLSTLRRMLPRMSRAAKNLLRRSWYFLARDDQRPPPEPWQIWLFMAGRGAGKTRTGAEYARARVKAGCRRLALIAPTAGDCRDVMVGGRQAFSPYRQRTITIIGATMSASRSTRTQTTARFPLPARAPSRRAAFLEFLNVRTH